MRHGRPRPDSHLTAAYSGQREPPRPSGKISDEQCRLARRVEGDFWNAYLAHNDTMDGAVLLGSIRAPAVKDPDRKARFFGLMKETAAAAVKDLAGASSPIAQ